MWKSHVGILMWDLECLEQIETKDEHMTSLVLTMNPEQRSRRRCLTVTVT